MEIRFIVLEKAYATTSREMTIGTLMWMEVPGGGPIGGGDTKSGSCVDRGFKESPK